MRALLLFLCGLCSLSAYAATFYLDPELGDISNDGSLTAPWPGLAEVLAAGLVETQEYNPLPYDPEHSQLVVKHAGAPVKAGDTLLLLTGLYGEVEIDRAYNTDWITIRAAPGHTPVLAGLHLRSVQFWRLEGLTISSEPHGYYTTDRLLYVESHGFRGPASDIEIRDCYLYSGTDSWSWSAEDWLARSRNGIHIKGDRVRVENNLLHNVDMGISLVGDSCQALRNQIVNFSGDGIRPLGAYLLVEGNLIKNCFDVDDNHDDGIQSYNLGTYDVHDVTIRGNMILNYEDPNQPLLGPLQGIGLFDGPYTNWLVENNVIAVNHWHGITFLGGYDCVVRNNTVLDPTPDITPGASWIRIADDKDGNPSAGCIVKNNVANRFVVDGELGHNVELSTYADYESHFTDYTGYDFYPLPQSSLIDQGDDAVAPMVDIVGTVRPQGMHCDIGAYEYVVPTTVSEPRQNPFILYPNPATESVLFTWKEEFPRDRLLKVYNQHGQLWQQLNLPAYHQRVWINIAHWPAGSYWFTTKGGVAQVLKI